MEELLQEPGMGKLAKRWAMMKAPADAWGVSILCCVFLQMPTKTLGGANPSVFVGPIHEN